MLPLRLEGELNGVARCREREMLGFMPQRCTNAQTAHELFVELPNVKTHVSSIPRKLRLRSLQELFDPGAWRTPVPAPPVRG